MADVVFKDLCIDVTAARRTAVAKFWSAALGQPMITHDDGEVHIAAPPDGPTQRTIWINTVPEPVTTKSRVHLDLRVAEGDPAPIVEAGGTIERTPDDDVSWHVVNDPGGVPLCVFGPHPAAPDALGPFEIVVDAADPESIAAWWAERTGGTVNRRDGDSYVWIEGAAGFPFMFWVFQQVPETKTAKNRVHWDVHLVDTTIEELVAAGATLLRRKDHEIRWSVMADPDGNEFCAFD